MSPTDDLPLAGKTVAVLHAAWHSCGSWQVNIGQMAAYRSLGARVISIAIMDMPGPPPPEGRWAAYLPATQDAPADARYFAATPVSALWRSGLLRDGWWPLIHGDQATWLIEVVRRADAPRGLAQERVDLVHANHYFTLPFAKAHFPDAPVIVETQDIQADQYVLRNKSGFFIPPYATHANMLAVELDWMRRADLCVHLNEREHLEFSRLLPEKRHALIYPAVAAAPTGPGGEETIIVASDNPANFTSLRWFLSEVLPKAEGAPVAIYGNIDAGVKARDPALYDAHAALFRGRVADLGAVYAGAKIVLLPTIDGHGLSIKAVEALSCGAPLVANRAAFRGMGIDPATLANVTLAEDPESFAAAWREAAGRPAPQPRETSDTRRFYEEAFSIDAYRRNLWAAAEPVLG